MRPAAALILAALAASLPAAAPRAAPAQAPAGAAARTAVEIRYGEWVDPARGGRKVPYKLYLPAGTGPFPLVIHSHGLGGSREASTYILTAVAEAGYAVVAVQHAGSDSGLMMGAARPGDEAGVVAAGRAGMTAEAARGRYGDIPFALDQIASDPALKGRVDMGRIGMSGHSFGALSTLTAVGQRLPAMPDDTSFQEPRIKAAIAYSPNKPRGDDPRAADARIKTPMLHFTGTEDKTPFDLEKTPFERTTPFQAIQGADQFLIILTGADHALFGGRRDQMKQLKAIDPPQMEIVKAETIRFWDAYLKGDKGALAAECELPKRIAGAGTAYTKAMRCGPPTPIAAVEGLR
jgi:predicted dienelactone hydrolase